MGFRRFRPTQVALGPCPRRRSCNLAIIRVNSHAHTHIHTRLYCVPCMCIGFHSSESAEYCERVLIGIINRAHCIALSANQHIISPCYPRAAAVASLRLSPAVCCLLPSSRLGSTVPYCRETHLSAVSSYYQFRLYLPLCALSISVYSLNLSLFVPPAQLFVIIFPSL